MLDKIISFVNTGYKYAFKSDCVTVTEADDEIYLRNSLRKLFSLRYTLQQNILT